jgi:hypothetical protein
MEFLNQIIAWVDLHTPFTGIVVSLVVGIVGGVFGRQYYVKKSTSLVVKGNQNSTIQAERDTITTSSSNNAMEQQAGNQSQLLSGDNSQLITNVTHNGNTIINVMFPGKEEALEQQRENARNFVAELENPLSTLHSEPLKRFSEARIMGGFESAIKSASLTNSKELHKILSQLILDFVQKPKNNIVELAIYKSIEVASDLDFNLIKILALSFMFSKTKYTYFKTKEQMFEKLKIVCSEFKDIDISPSKFEYLEAISCGKYMQIVSMPSIIGILLKSYGHLFLKKFTLEQIKILRLPDDVERASFIRINNDNFQISPYMGLYLFEEVPICVDGSPYSISDQAIKEQLNEFFKNNQLTEKEIKSLILKRIPDFENIIKIWDDGGFLQFSLTAVGIAIGRAYLEQRNFGTYDINAWIN